MVRVTIDEEVQKKLLIDGQTVELVDPSGNLLGRFLPEVGASAQAEWEPINSPYSEEELDRLAKDEGPGITTDELLARLKAKP